MIPKVLDANSFLLRDYFAFIQNIASRIPSLTSKWTDYSVSEPDTIFLNNTAYLQDLVSYAIDYRYLQTSVKYTSSQDFMNSICILTGGSAPFYKETYSLKIVSSIKQKEFFLPKGSILFDSTNHYCVTTLRDSYIYPSTETHIPVIEGNLYNKSLISYRLNSIKSLEELNLNSVFSLDSYEMLDRQFNVSRVLYNFLVYTVEFCWLNSGDNNSSVLLSPAVTYKPYEFIGFSLNKENLLTDTAAITVPGFLGEASLSKQAVGSKPTGIDDSKVAYYESLQEIYTDINSSLYNYRTKNEDLIGLTKTSLTIKNNRDMLVASSHVDYSEGYIDVLGYFPPGSSLIVEYDYYNLDSRHPLEELQHNKILMDIDETTGGSFVINLELPENSTVKQYSLVVKAIMPDSQILYMTDYNGDLIVPRGNESYKEFNYLLEDGLSSQQLDFSPGEYLTNIVEIHVSDTCIIDCTNSVDQDNTYKEIHVREILGGRDSFKAISPYGTVTDKGETKATKQYPVFLLLPTQTPMDVYIQNKLYRLPAHNLSGIYLYNAKGKPLHILDRKKNPLYAIPSVYSGMKKTPGYLEISQQIENQFQGIANCLFFDRNRVYFIPTNYKNKISIGTKVTVIVDQQCCFSHKITSQDNTRISNFPASILSVPFPKSYIEAVYPNPQDTPQEVMIQIGQRKYYAVADSNVSSKNYYNVILSTNLTRHTIDLYSMATRYKQITEQPVNVSALVYLKPLDVPISQIELVIHTELEKYFESLEVNEFVREAGVLSRIIHSSEYIAYAEIQLPVGDIDPSDFGDSILFVLGRVKLTFKNPDILQF